MQQERNSKRKLLLLQFTWRSNG